MIYVNSLNRPGIVFFRGNLLKKLHSLQSSTHEIHFLPVKHRWFKTNSQQFIPQQDYTALI